MTRCLARPLLDMSPFSNIAGKLLWLAALNTCAFVLIAALVGVVWIA